MGRVPAGSLSGNPAAEAAARALRQRTLTTLYNTRPQWLTDAHTTLDSAVDTACGWPADISEDDALRGLLGTQFNEFWRSRMVKHRALRYVDASGARSAAS